MPWRSLLLVLLVSPAWGRVCPVVTTTGVPTTSVTSTTVPTTTSTSGATTSTTSTSTSSSSSTSTSTSSTTTTTSGGGTTTTNIHVLDDFERGSLPPSGGNWTTGLGPYGGTNCIIVASSDLSVSAADFSAVALWTSTGPSTTTSYTCAKLSGAGEGETGVCLGADTSGNAACCSAWNDGGAFPYWNLSKYIGGSFTEFVETAATPVFTTGNFIGIQRTSATAFQCYRSTDGTTWTALGSGATVASIPDPGTWAAVTDNDGGATTPFMLEQWEGGEGTLPTARVCGVP